MMRPLVEVTRHDVRTGREVVESVHMGHLVVVEGHADTTGGATHDVTHEVGDAQHVTFPRSALKPLQATLCIELLQDAGVELDDDELAIGWASHRAEPAQLEAVRSLLRRAGVVEDALTCPRASVPDDARATRSRLAHNCSGKHALFALTAHTLGLPTDPSSLLAHDGPLQTRLIAGLEGMLGPLAAIGVDGCGAPAVAVPLVALARAFADIASSARHGSVRAAGLAHPALIAGHERGPAGTRHPVVDTALLEVGVVAKRGAEGVLAAGWHTPDGRSGGIAAKAGDGGLRGVATAVVAHLEAAGVAPPGTWREIAPRGGAGQAGTVRAAPAS